MRVHLLASTMLHDMGMNQTSYKPHELSEAVTSADELAELAGRGCYQSWDRPRPATATNEGYLANILDMGHYSVLEHASASFHVSDISRAFLAEITRHRHLSFSVLSQRFVDARDLDNVVPPALESLDDQDRILLSNIIYDHFSESLNRYEELLEELRAKGFAGKKAKEIARAVLPNSTDTPLVVSGNMRAWRDVLGKRWHVAADQELQEFASQVLTHLRKVAYNSFQDFPTEPIGS